MSKSIERRAATQIETTRTVGASRPVRTRIGKNVAVMTLSAGIVATIALPAYAFTPDAGRIEADAPVAAADLQNVVVGADASTAVASRDAFTATTEAELEAMRIAEEQARIAEQQRVEQERLSQERQAAQQAQTRTQSSYSGPTAAQYLAAPAPSTNANLSGVAAVASQYKGVPYIFGGSTPAGFDCSGFTMFVYAQFGVKLQHSATWQGQNGTRVSEAEAVPGDLVVIDGGAHIGFYMGNHEILDAPKPGDVVKQRKIWTSNYYIVRY